MLLLWLIIEEIPLLSTYYHPLSPRPCGGVGRGSEPMKHCDAAAKRGILLLKRTSEALKRDPPDLRLQLSCAPTPPGSVQIVSEADMKRALCRGALAECQAAVDEDPSNPE
jgi:hypothetical protein